MIEHIVCFKLNDINKFDEIGELFAELAVKIPAIQSYKYTKNVYTKRETNMDALLKVYFKNEEDLETYLFDENHVEFAKKAKQEFWTAVFTTDTIID